MDSYLITRTATATVRAVDGGQDTTPGEFQALVSVFGNTDSYGDVVERGAFTKSLAEWTIRGSLPPVVWSHQFSDPANFLGVHTAIEETDEGLVVTGQLNLNRPKAAQVWELMREGTIVEFSFSGIVRDAEPVDGDDDDGLAMLWGPMRIKEIDLWEAGPCFKGANPATELISVKADPRLEQLLRTPQLTAKAGRVLSQANLDALITARDQLSKVIDAAQAEPDAEASKTHPDPEVDPAPEGPEVVPTENPVRSDDPNEEDSTPEDRAAEKTVDTGPAGVDPAVRALLELSTL